MSRWTHSVCDECYAELEPGRTPYRLVEEHKLRSIICCRCGDVHTSGIWYRRDPDLLHCQGRGNAHEEEQGALC